MSIQVYATRVVAADSSLKDAAIQAMLYQMRHEMMASAITLKKFCQRGFVEDVLDDAALVDGGPLSVVAKDPSLRKSFLAIPFAKWDEFYKKKFSGNLSFKGLLKPEVKLLKEITYRTGYTIDVEALSGANNSNPITLKVISPNKIAIGSGGRGWDSPVFTAQDLASLGMTVDSVKEMFARFGLGTAKREVQRKPKMLGPD
jgi:hypothetical protein